MAKTARGQITITSVSDGASAWVADLYNQVDSVSCDETGHPVAQQMVSTPVRLFYGNTEKTFTAASPTPLTRNGSVIQFDSRQNGVAVYLDGNELKVTYYTDAQISGKDDFAFTLQATEDATVKRTVHFIVNGVKGDVYNLKPSVDEIHATRDTSGNYLVGNQSTYNLSCGYTKRAIDGTVTEYANVTGVIDSKYCVYFRRRNRSTQAWDSTYYRYDNVSYEGYVRQLALNTYDAVEFVLSTSAAGTVATPANIIDRETVNVLADGVSGKDAPQVLFEPSVLYVDADSDGKSTAGNKTFNVTMSLVVNGTQKTVSSVETSVPSSTTYTAVNASYSQQSGALTVTVLGSQSASKWDGAFVKATLQGGGYTATGLLPIVSKRKGATGDNAVEYKFVCEPEKVKLKGGVYTPSTVKVQLHRIEGGNDTVLAWADLPSGMTIQKSMNNSSWLTVGSTEFNSLKNGMGSSTFFDVGSNQNGTVFFRAVQNNVVKATASFALLADGEQGLTGKAFYMSGQWDSTVEYVSNDWECPLVWVNTQSGGIEWYYLPTGTSIDQDPRTANPNPWQKADNYYKVIITEAIFADFASFGSAVINGDWMISQHGKYNDGGVMVEKGVMNENDNTTYWLDNGVKKPYYMKFAENDPTATVYDHFAPDFALDLKTGTLYGKKMNISGTIHAENFFHRICFFDGTNYSNPCYRRTSDYVDGGDSFVTGEYYTLDDIESISGNNLHGETGFVQSTGSADIVVSFFHEDNENNEPSYRNHVNLPNPDKYEGKKVQLYSYNIGQYNGEMYELWLDDQNRSQIAGAVSKLWPDGTVEVANNTFYSRLPIPIGGSVELVSTKVHKTNPNDYGFDCVWLMLENRSGGDIIIDGGGVIPTSGVSSVAGLTGAVSAASLVQNISTALTNAGFRTTDDNSTYKLTLNGSQKGTAGGADLGSFYAPIAAGSNGQFLKSTGSGAPSWSALPTASTSAAGIVQLGTGSTQAAKGDHNHDGTYQPVISDLATIRNNAANGNTAFGWGNHASAGYALASALSRYLLAHGMSTENNGVNDFFVNFPKDDSNTNAMDVDFQGGASYNFDADVYIGNKLVKVVDDININASNSAYTQIKIAKLTVASSGLRTVSFTALLSTCETTSAVYDKNSHLLHLLVRRESSGSASYDFTITQFGENAPGNAYVVRDGNNTFYVYIDKESGLYAPYYVLTPLMTKGDVEFMNTRESLTEEAKVAATKAVVLGYHTHTNKSVLDTITEAMITKLNGIEAGANKYTHPTNGANTTIAAADGRVLSAITVNNLGHVTSVSYKALSNSDIPSTLTLNALAVSGSIGGSSADFDSLTSENATVTGNLTVKGGGLLLTYPFTKVNGDAQTTPAFKTYWRKIGSYTFTGTGSSQAIIELFSGDGYNGNASQNSNAKITLKHGWQQADSSGNRVAENSVGVICERYGYPCEFQVRVEATGYTTGHVWILVPVGYGNGFYRVSGHGMTWTHNTAAADTTTDPTHNQKAVTYYDYQKKLTFVNTKNNETVDGNSNSFSAICFPFTKSVDGRITLDLSGISANIPTATSSVLGGVKVGDTLAISSGVLNQKSGIATAGTYTKVAVDTYGRVTAGTTLAGSDIPNISATKIAFDKLDAARLPDLSSVYLPNRDIKVYQGDKAVDYIKVATVRITGTGLTNGGFSAIFSSFSIVEKNSFILNLSIRREALTGETPSKYDFTIMPTGTVKPRGAWVTRTTTQEDNTTVEYFDVYIGKRSGYWAPYYMMHPFQTDGNVTFCNEPAASISNIVAEAEYGGIAASAADADTVDGKHASEFALATDLNGYLAKTGGDVRGVVNIKGQLNLQDASGNTKIALFGSSGSLYIGGTTDNYLAATHKWVEDKGYEANVINTVKVNGSTLTVSNKAVDIQRASENAAGVVIIGDGLKEDNDGHLTLRLGNGLEFETVDSLQTVAVSFGTTATTVAAGNHNHSGVYQPVIGDLDSIRGNASRGNMAYRWGNHADAGYQAAITSSTSLSVAALTSKNGISVGTPTNNAYPVVINSAGITINGNSVLTSYTEQYTGTVTKVEMATASGSHMSVSGSPVTSSGKFTLSVDTGYAIPTTAKQTNWDTAYTNNHTHSNKAVLDGITSNKVSTWDGKQPKLTFLNTKNNNAEAAFSNLYLPLKDVSSGYATLDLYAHPAGANTTITAASKKVLSAITVDSYGHVTSVSSKSLTSADIPDLSSVYLPNRNKNINQSNMAVDYIKVATVRFTGTGLANGGFSALFSSYVVAEKNSFILNLSIRREALAGSTPSRYDFTIMPVGTVKPRGAWVTRTTTQEDNTTVEYFDVYIGKYNGQWAPYYMMHPFVTDGNVTFCNEPAASISNIVAEAEYGGVAASAADADTVDGKHASEFALSTDLSDYLGKSGGTVTGVLNVKGQINVQDTGGNTKIAMFGSSGNLYIGGTTNDYLAATHKWVEDKGYVTSVKVGTTPYNPSSGVITLPAYPTTLPASDVSAWAKETNKPTYTLDEVADGSNRKLDNYQTKLTFTNANNSQEIKVGSDVGNIELPFSYSQGKLTFVMSAHTHGNITSDGKINENVTIGNYDRLVIVDGSDSNKIKSTSITFDGSTATKALTQKGTFETFLTSHQKIPAMMYIGTASSETALQGGSDKFYFIASNGITLATSGASDKSGITISANFGTTATTVAKGNHTHSQYMTSNGMYTENDGRTDFFVNFPKDDNDFNKLDVDFQRGASYNFDADVFINNREVATQYWVSQQGFLISEQYKGTVTKVEMEAASGSHLSVSGSPVTSSGKFTLSVDSNYSIPTTAKQTNWDTAYTNSHTHSNKTVLDGITFDKVSTWDGKQPKLTFLNTKNNNAEAAFSNLYLPLKDVSSGYATLDLYAHPAGANTTITAASKKVLSAITVDSYGHVTSVSSKSLTSADIPDLSSVYLPLSGGTLTGNLDSKINTAERGVTPNSSLYRGIYFRDKNSKHLGQVESSVRKDGQVGLSLMVARPSADDVLEYGGLYIYKTVGQTGNKQASYNANTGAFTAHSFIKSGGTSSQFLKADGSVDSNQYALASTVLEYFSSSVVSLGTSGNYLTWTNGDNITETITVPYATNADTLDGKHASDFVSSSDSVTKNYILAGPASGNASSPSFRALVAADIPNLTGTYVPKSGFFYSSSQWNSSAVTPNGIQLPLKLVSSGIYAFDMLGAYNTAVKRIYGMPTPQTGSDRRDYVRIATLTASDSGLSVIGFSAILMSTELLRKNSFILNVSIRRESTFSNTKCECVITPIGTVTPPNLYIRSSDYKTFYVYIDKKYNLYDPYFDLCPLYSKNVTFESEAVSSLPSGSSFSAQAEIGGAAPKLYTARSLWGQNFDGTADVSGDMTGVGNITASGKLTVNGKSSTRVVAEDGTLTATSISAGTWSLASSINVEFTSSTATVSIARAEPSWPTPTYSFDGPVVQSSDSRLKTIEKYLEPSVYDIAFAPLVAFRWKNGNGRQNVGTLAQYWEKVLPQAVHEDGDGFLSLEYSTIALAAGVTASRKAVDNERRILELEREVSALKTRVAELEQEEIEN